MQSLRTLPRLVYALVALFLVAQFAGVVASPLESAQTFAHAADMHMHQHHMHAVNMRAMSDEIGAGHHHGDQGSGHVDGCCALHAFFAGVLPAVIAVETTDMIVQRLAPAITDFRSGIEPGRFDRPPRPYALI
jgi:hypothetical protein